MSRWRKIATKMWGDEKFRSLSKPQPNAQTLWIFLLTGPFTGRIPGLLRAGQAGMAESLGWPLKSFRKCWGEISGAGMALADWDAMLVFVPKAISHNGPENPNVIRSWRTEWEEMPECNLKAIAHRAFKEHFETTSEAFREAFIEAFGKDYREITVNVPVKALASDPVQEETVSGSKQDRFVEFYEAYPRHVGKEAALKAWKRLDPDDDLVAEILTDIEKRKATIWRESDPTFIPYPATYINGRRWTDEIPSAIALGGRESRPSRFEHEIANRIAEAG